MLRKMRLSEDVSYITLCKPLPLVLHAYVRPFVLAYLSLVSVWFSLYGFEESLEVFFLCLAVIAAINSSTDLERNPHRQKSKLIPDVTLQTATIVKKIGKGKQFNSLGSLCYRSVCPCIYSVKSLVFVSTVCTCSIASHD